MIETHSVGDRNDWYIGSAKVGEKTFFSAKDNRQDAFMSVCWQIWEVLNLKV